MSIGLDIIHIFVQCVIDYQQLVRERVARPWQKVLSLLKLQRAPLLSGRA
jgi:hypothetical protein